MSVANGRHIDGGNAQVYVRESGDGPPLVLLHGATVSTSEVWADHPWSWTRHVPQLAERFRVIAIDTPGHGRSPSDGNPVTYEQFADVVAAVARELDLDRPAICGFSDGGHAATLFAIRHPQLSRAVVNCAGFDTFNPASPSFAAVRMRQGGSPEATEPLFEGIGERIGEERLALIQRDHGVGWQDMFRSGFRRWTQPGNQTLEDFGRVDAPTLILNGDRDHFCSVEEASAAFRRLPKGELCVLPNLDHSITDAVTTAVVDFLLRYA